MCRRFVARTRAKVHAWARRPLGELDLVALMVHGIGFGQCTLVVALGTDSTGTKHALAVRESSTENATLCRSLLAHLIARCVPGDRSILVVIDCGTGLLEAEKPWRRLLGKADMPKFVTAVRRPRPRARRAGVGEAPGRPV
ncbi:MAG: hypothetical protein H7247_10200 [Polaromonas sp.]|nr:hypothetical protein [Gemmatimonadaceae bacterium]